MTQLIYKKGDLFKGTYEVYDVIGKGGFGVVYLVYSHYHKNVYALKTFHDEYLYNEQLQERFKKEALLWISMDRHPYIVRAHRVDITADIPKSRLFIVMEYIVPDEHGLNSLDLYLRHQPLDLAQSLRWSIQFCYGIEYAYSKGLRAHRDIKPANIMIDKNKLIKISDFGLGSVIRRAKSVCEQNSVPAQIGGVALMQTEIGTSIGTPEYMSPEQFTDFITCDKRSDIYSFGIVLYQMASGGNLPFYADDLDYRWAVLKHAHESTSISPLDSPLFPVVRRCLEKKPNDRYQSFVELRDDLEVILMRQTGEIIKLPAVGELDKWELEDKGDSLSVLNKYEEAIICYDKLTEQDPKVAKFWYKKGSCLGVLGRSEEAIKCYDNFLEIGRGPTWISGYGQAKETAIKTFAAIEKQ